MPDFTPVIAAEMMVERMLTLNPSVTAPALQYNDDTNGWTTIATLNVSSGYAWDLKEVSSSPVNKPYIRLRIIDTTGLKAKLDKTEAVTYDGARYKVSREQRPFGTPKVWVLRLDYLEDV
jgi:hypothetical protein